MEGFSSAELTTSAVSSRRLGGGSVWRRDGEAKPVAQQPHVVVVLVLRRVAEVEADLLDG
jgi:hypothetical protein